jgi:dihydroorotate dehydrogenase (NAD+) catalytic subunit
MIDTSVAFCGLHFSNPIVTASGTFDAREYSDFIDLNELGGVSTKSVSKEPRAGNPPPRLAEVYAGLLNAIGLENPGVELFLERDVPFLAELEAKIIVNVVGKTIEDYLEVIEKLGDAPIDIIELNVSCPNVKEGGISFGAKPETVENITRQAKEKSKQPLIVKLTPNAADISEIAKAAESGGADGISLINTLLGMAIDIVARKPKLANVTGGLSGPAIKPVAVRMVYETYRAVKIPILGMGGITTAEDAVEFLMAGATCVGIGTANFINPRASVEILEGLREFMKSRKILNVYDIIGAANDAKHL